MKQFRNEIALNEELYVQDQEIKIKDDETDYIYFVTRGNLVERIPSKKNGKDLKHK